MQLFENLRETFLGNLEQLVESPKHASYLKSGVPPARPWGFWGRFALKTGLDFAYFGLESVMVFQGTTGVYERIYHFSSKWLLQIENGF